MIKDWFQLRNWAAAPIQAQLWAWIFLPKSCFPRNPPILDSLQEILISIMISRGPWSNEGAAIDLEDAQNRPVTGAPLLEMWHFILFIHLEKKSQESILNAGCNVRKCFFTNLESSDIRDVSKIGVIPYIILFRTGICRLEGSKWKEIEENGWKVNSSNCGIYFSALCLCTKWSWLRLRRNTS